jgi:hypothetical protein
MHMYISIIITSKDSESQRSRNSYESQESRFLERHLIKDGANLLWSRREEQTIKKEFMKICWNSVVIFGILKHTHRHTERERHIHAHKITFVIWHIPRNLSHLNYIHVYVYIMPSNSGFRMERSGVGMARWSHLLWWLVSIIPTVGRCR